MKGWVSKCKGYRRRCSRRMGR